MKDFSNEDLKAGMLVELKNGVTGILIPTKNDGLEVFNQSLRAETSAYLLEDSVTNNIDRSYAIIKVYDISCTFNLFDIFSRKLLWQYEKEMTLAETLAEIEKELGCKVKIIE